MSLGRIVLAPPERRELKRRARKRSLAVELVKRAEVILMLAAGHSYREVRQRLDCSDEYTGSGRSAFKRSVWRDSIRVIAVVNAEPEQRRPRRGSCRRISSSQPGQLASSILFIGIPGFILRGRWMQALLAVAATSTAHKHRRHAAL